MHSKTTVKIALIATLLSPVAIYASQTMTPSELRTLAKQCVPAQYIHVVEKIVEKESTRKPFAINANGAKLNIQPKNADEAKIFIDVLRERKINFDVGLGQINSQHFLPGRFFDRYGFKLEHALDPCTNLLMSVAIFDEAYARTRSIQKALSIYNTGSPDRGLRNGYVSWFLKDEEFLAIIDREFQR